MMKPTIEQRLEHHADSRRMEIRTLLKEIHGMSQESAFAQEKDTAIAERLRQLDRLVATARGINMQLKECGDILKLLAHFRDTNRL